MDRTIWSILKSLFTDFEVDSTSSYSPILSPSVVLNTIWILEFGIEFSVTKKKWGRLWELWFWNDLQLLYSSTVWIVVCYVWEKKSKVYDCGSILKTALIILCNRTIMESVGHSWELLTFGIWIKFLIGCLYHWWVTNN